MHIGFSRRSMLLIRSLANHSVEFVAECLLPHTCTAKTTPPLRSLLRLSSRPFPRQPQWDLSEPMAFTAKAAASGFQLYLQTAPTGAVNERNGISQNPLNICGSIRDAIWVKNHSGAANRI
jgi:hypothetical protein